MINSELIRYGNSRSFKEAGNAVGSRTILDLPRWLKNNHEYASFMSIITRYILAHPNQPLVISDYGCGAGAIGTYYASEAIELSGSAVHLIARDLMGGNIHQTRRAISQIKPATYDIAIGDIRNPGVIPTTPLSDITILQEVLHWMPWASTQEEIINSISQSLKPGGLFILSFATLHNKARMGRGGALTQSRLLSTHSPETLLSKGNKQLMTFTTSKWCLDTAKECGLSMVSQMQSYNSIFPSAEKLGIPLLPSPNDSKDNTYMAFIKNS